MGTTDDAFRCSPWRRLSPRCTNRSADGVTLEPVNLKEWIDARNEASLGRLYTCGRPGRGTYGRKRLAVPESVIDEWIHGLPSANPLHIVSLLGQKADQLSEFSYYPFRSKFERGSKPTFQEWLDCRYSRHITVDEYPTIDCQGIPARVLKPARARIIELLADGRSVVVVDSAGKERTARVCKAVGWSQVIGASDTGFRG
jgi:hypothetical protein